MLVPNADKDPKQYAEYQQKKKAGKVWDENWQPTPKKNVDQVIVNNTKQK